jgi:hypothetical protein
MFGVTYPGALFIESIMGPHEHEKWCVKISHPGSTGMHFVTANPTRCKNKSSVQHVPTRILWKPHWSHPNKKKGALSFHALDTPEYTA